MNILVPEVSCWYQDTTSNDLFTVVAIDEDRGSIEIQMLNGEVDQIDSTTWQALYLTQVAAPVDWRSPFELHAEDQGNSDPSVVPTSLSTILTAIEREKLAPDDDIPSF